MIYYKWKENLAFAKTAFKLCLCSPSYYVARTLFIWKVSNKGKITLQVRNKIYRNII